MTNTLLLLFSVLRDVVHLCSAIFLQCFQTPCVCILQLIFSCYMLCLSFNAWITFTSFRHVLCGKGILRGCSRYNLCSSVIEFNCFLRFSSCPHTVSWWPFCVSCVLERVYLDSNVQIMSYLSSAATSGLISPCPWLPQKNVLSVPLFMELALLSYQLTY
jgi:hypothetical protein